MCRVHTDTYVALLAPVKRTTPLATQKRRPRIYNTWYVSLRIRTSDSSQLEKRKEKKIQQIKENKTKESEKGEEKKQQKEESRKGKENNTTLADLRNCLKTALGS